MDGQIVAQSVMGNGVSIRSEVLSYKKAGTNLICILLRARRSEKVTGGMTPTARHSGKGKMRERVERSWPVGAARREEQRTFRPVELFL